MISIEETITHCKQCVMFDGWYMCGLMKSVNKNIHIGRELDNTGFIPVWCPRRRK